MLTFCCSALWFITIIANNGDITHVKNVQRQYNSIHYTSDEILYGQREYWASPRETLSRWQGDCEDISIVKYFALIEKGIDSKHLRLAYLQIGVQSFHIVVEVHFNETILVLDNRYSEVRLANEEYYKQRILSFNKESLWINGQIVGAAIDKMERWADLLKRMSFEQDNHEIDSQVGSP
ncbi:TPA: transglutaminase-like cysteine peptidase [Vibrio parahaemolyticus]